MAVTTDAWYATTVVGVMRGEGGRADWPSDNTYGFYWGYFSPPTNQFTSGFGSPTGWGNNISVGADTNTYGQAFHGTSTGAILLAKTKANVAAAQTPTSSSVTSTTATIACNYTPNVNSSTCSAQLQYKKTTDVSWTNAGSPQTTGGTTEISISRNITGLEPSTQYQERLVITRATINDTTLTSATASFTTLAGEPTVTTDAASVVASASAILNGTLDINAGTGVDVYFKWDTATPPVANTTANQSKSADGAFEQAISGLTASTLYYFQAFVSFSTPTGSPNEGSILSFTTAADPVADSLEEDHLTIQEYDAVYGVQKAFVFLAASPAATTSDKFLSAAAPWATTECRITIDGGALADCTNAPTRIGTSAFFTITLTAAELAGENIWVHISDSGTAARDVALHIRTSIEAGKMVLNAAQMTNTTALLATGIGSGHGISAVSGATGSDINGVLGSHVIRKSTATGGGASTITLDASASATNDFYNGALVVVISGTGAAQSRFIIDYDGGTKVATVHKAWGTNPANGAVFIIVPAEDVWSQVAVAELSAIPTAVSSWADKLAFVWERFAYKRTETATVFTQMKADSTTALGTAAVSDDGTTQSHAKLV